MSSSQDAMDGSLFQGWCWRGARLEIGGIAGYAPGEPRKHMGVARAWTGSLADHGVILRIHAHAARIQCGAVVFPPDTVFHVLGLHNLVGGRVAIGLEQMVEGQNPYPRFETEFAEWAASVPESLPIPDPAQAQEADQPFARWALDAEEGDAPIQGVMYEFDEAVAFSAAWSGCEAEPVTLVLEARHRYLELAGIAGGEFDEALQKEREAFAHLLPEQPGHLDGHELRYLALSTGLPEAAILCILHGETAYLDNLGLIAWESEEERNEVLGAPSLSDALLGLEDRRAEI